MAFGSRKPPTKFSGIEVLYDPQAQGLEAELDVVLVHGLNGDYIGTWKYSAKGKPDVFWPRDLLPQKQPKTRVLSFGYNADIYGGSSIGRIRDHAQNLVGNLIDVRDSDDCDQSRPIVFVAHSLGGLIVKEALREARQHSDQDTANGKHNQAIANATRGILLFSTPHHGGDKKKWLQIADGFAPLATQSNTSPLVEALKSKSIELDDLSQDFRHHAGRYAIISFFEQEVYPGTSADIVEKNSALTNLPHEVQFPLGKSHLDMCRFASQSEFRPVLLRIQRATEGGPDARIAASRAAFSVPGMASIIPEPTQQPRLTKISMLLEKNGVTGELAEHFLRLALMQEPEMVLPPGVKYRFQT